mgnify:CR=1 FL=1
MKNELLQSIKVISDILKHKAKNDTDINKEVLYYSNRLISLIKKLDNSMFYAKDLDEIINLTEIHLSWDENQIKNCNSINKIANRLKKQSLITRYEVIR